MLSIQNISSASSGADYYLKAVEYYQGDGEREKPKFQGKQIQTLIGEGEFTKEKFTSLLNGEMPNGQRLGKSVGEGISHRPGVDLTFSAPKSLSILALIGGKSELTDAHNHAVTQTLKYAEKHLSFTRIKGEHSKVDNLNAIKFLQTTSRENDPQIHTHCAVLNAVQCEDGKWRCMETGAIYDSKMMLGQMYRLILARILVQEYGYQIEVSKKDGTFEIVGVPKEINQLFSKRRETIEEVAEKAGITTAAGMAAITKITRKRSIELPFDQQLKAWNKELETNGLALPDLKPDPSRQITQANKIKIARDAISASIKKLDTHMKFYTREEVIYHAMLQSFDKIVCPEELNQAFDRELKRNGLITVTLDKRQYISAETFMAEGDLRTIAKKSWNQRHLFVGERLKHALYRFVINKTKTVDSLAKAINSKQLVSIVDNFSPVHDEKSLSRVVTLSKVFGKDVEVVSMSSVDKENLYAIGVESCGLNKYIKEQATKDGVVIVFGSEKATMQQMERLAKSASLTNSKLVLLNAKDNSLLDTRYSPVDLLAQSGVCRVEMRSAAELFVSGANILQNKERIIDVKDNEDLVSHFSEKGSGLIISANHVNLNRAIRNALIEEGKLGSHAITVNNYVHQQLTDIELNRTVNYLPGDLLKIEKLDILSGKLRKLKEGDHFKVISSEGSTLVVEHGKLKKQFKIDLDKRNISFGDLKVYKPQKLELRVGDQVILPKDDIYGERFRNQIGMVSGISDKTISISLGGARAFEIYHQNNREVFLERAWALPAYRRFEGWKGKIDLHLSPESAKNVLKNLSDSKIARLGTVYTKDHQATLKKIDQHSAKINFRSNSQHQVIVENSTGERIAEITREIKQTPEDRERLAENVIVVALKKITEKEYAFTKEDVLREAGAISVGGLSFEEMSHGLDKRIESSDLIKVGKHTGLTTYTTKEMADKRADVLSKVDNQIAPICSKSDFTENMADLKLEIPPEHCKTVEGLLTSTHSISMVQGFAGTAKTSLTLKNFAKIAKAQGYEVKGLAPTHSACLELGSKAGLEGRTVESSMQEIIKEKLHLNQKTVVIVDESSMLSIPDTLNLIDACTSHGARLVFVGDQNQQPSVGAGEIFRELVNHDQADVHHIKHILRQKTPEYREAIQNLAMGQIEKFFESMKASLIEVKGRGVGEATSKELSHAISSEYVSYAKGERDYAQIITLTNDARHQINKIVRELLFEKNELSPEISRFKTYQSVDHSTSTKHFASTLVAGDAVRFNKPDDRYGILAGEYLAIAQVSDRDNTLILRREDGSELTARPDRTSLMSVGGIEVYKQEDRSIGIGEKIIFRRSIEDVGVLNTDMGKVIALEGSVARISLKHREVELDLSKPENRHWDYGYAVTSHAFQGKDCETVLCHFDTRSKPLAHYQSFYVAVTRGEYSMKVFTNCIEQTKTAVVESYLEKNPVIEKIRQDPISHILHKSQPLLDPQERHRMGQSAALICKTLMGEPLKTRGTTLYYGQKNGSLRVETAGEKAGLWNDFAAGEGGDIIDLIKHRTGKDFNGSVELARSIVAHENVPRINYEIVANSPEPADNTSRIERAQAIFDSGVLIKGTPGEKYLHDHRKIPLDTIDRSASEIRYIPEFRFENKSSRKFSAVVFSARNAKSEVQAVQIVLIDPRTGGKLQGQCKYSFGVMKGSSLCLGKQGGDLYIAEGPETALSIFAAKPNADVRACFSAENIKNVFIPLSTGLVVICADNDGPGAASEKAVSKAVEFIKGHGVSVSVVMPRESGEDFNDVMKNKGAECVAKDVSNVKKIYAGIGIEL